MRSQLAVGFSEDGLVHLAFSDREGQSFAITPQDAVKLAQALVNAAEHVVDPNSLN
jgi:hypothetical protein